MAYQSSLSTGTTVGGMTPPLSASGGEGWLSAIFIELQLHNRLMEAVLVELLSMNQQTAEDKKGK